MSLLIRLLAIVFIIQVVLKLFGNSELKNWRWQDIFWSYWIIQVVVSLTCFSIFLILLSKFIMTFVSNSPIE